MPHLTPLTTSLWVLLTLATSGLLVSMIWTGSWKRWPSVFAFLYLHTAQAAFDAAVILSGHHPALYYYGHWIFAIGLYCAEIAIMLDLAIRLLGITPSVSRAIKRVLPSIALILFGVTFVLAFSGNYAYFRKVTILVGNIDEAIALAWFGTLLLVLFGVRAFGPEWSGPVRWIAIGLWIETFKTLLIAALAMQFQQLNLEVVRASCFILSLCLWSVAVLPCPSPVQLVIRITRFTISASMVQGGSLSK